MGKVDKVSVTYFRNKRIFADVFNYWIYDGEQIIQEQDLTLISDTHISLYPKKTRGKKKRQKKDFAFQKNRDVLMQLICMECNSMLYIILGIESQTDISYDMPARVMMYDAMEYDEQILEIKRKNLASKKKPISSAEFLRSYYKSDRIIPTITLVVYLGSDEWDGPRSLYDMFGIPKDKRFARVKNYEMDLIEPYRISEDEIQKFQTSMREVMLYLKYAEDRSKMVQLAEQQGFRNIDPVAASLINEVTGSLIEIPEGEEEIEMSKKMCKAWQEISDEAREKGMKEGRAAGMEEGRAVGLEEGRAAGMAQGMAQGMTEGKAEGELTKAKEIARNMAHCGMAIPVISQMTLEPEETIQQWLSETAATV